MSPLNKREAIPGPFNSVFLIESEAEPAVSALRSRDHPYLRVEVAVIQIEAHEDPVPAGCEKCCAAM
jgi:hypothetical protein